MIESSGFKMSMDPSLGRKLLPRPVPPICSSNELIMMSNRMPCTLCCCIQNPTHLSSHGAGCCYGVKRSSEMSSFPLVSSRWNPTAEQIQALEEMYRRGIRTPTAEQIKQIASRLRKFGKIEGKNVFYWFQNHKARERQKKRRQLDQSLSGKRTQQRRQHVDESKERKPTGLSISNYMHEDEQRLRKLEINSPSYGGAASLECQASMHASEYNGRRLTQSHEMEKELRLQKQKISVEARKDEICAWNYLDLSSDKSTTAERNPGQANENPPFLALNLENFEVGIQEDYDKTLQLFPVNDRKAVGGVEDGVSRKCAPNVFFEFLPTNNY